MSDDDMTDWDERMTAAKRVAADAVPKDIRAVMAQIHGLREELKRAVMALQDDVRLEREARRGDVTTLRERVASLSDAVDRITPTILG